MTKLSKDVMALIDAVMDMPKGTVLPSVSVKTIVKSILDDLEDLDYQEGWAEYFGDDQDDGEDIETWSPSDDFFFCQLTEGSEIPFDILDGNYISVLLEYPGIEYVEVKSTLDGRLNIKHFNRRQGEHLVLAKEPRAAISQGRSLRNCDTLFEFSPHFSVDKIQLKNGLLQIDFIHNKGDGWVSHKIG